MQSTVLSVTPLEGRGRTASPPAVGLTFLSLDSRLGMLRRRRRRTVLRQFAVGPLLLGMSILLLAAFGGMATLR